MRANVSFQDILPFRNVRATPYAAMERGSLFTFEFFVPPQRSLCLVVFSTIQTRVEHYKKNSYLGYFS